MRRRDLLTALGALALVPLSWESWRLGREAWSLTRTPEVVLSADESSALDLERSVLTILGDLGSLAPGEVDADTLAAVTAAHRDQLSALTEARAVGPAEMPAPGSPTTALDVKAGQRTLAEQAHAAALRTENGGFALLFASIEAGTRELLGVLQ